MRMYLYYHGRRDMHEIYSLSIREIPRAESKEFTKSSGYISQIILIWVLIPKFSFPICYKSKIFKYSINLNDVLVQYSMVLSSTVLYLTVLYFNALYCTILPVLYCNIVYCSVQGQITPDCSNYPPHPIRDGDFLSEALWLPIIPGAVVQWMDVSGISQTGILLRLGWSLYKIPSYR